MNYEQFIECLLNCVEHRQNETVIVEKQEVLKNNGVIATGITIRKEEIAIMKYIGAKDSFVRAPFILEGVLIGIFGAAIPLVVLYFAYEKAINYILTKFSILNTLLEFLPVSEVYRTLLPVGLALGVGIGFVGSFLTIKKHLKA